MGCHHRPARKARKLFVLLLSVSLFVGTVSMNEPYSFSPGNLPSVLTEPHVRSYRLFSRCSSAYITIRLKRRGVKAKGKSNSAYAKLSIESVDHSGTIRIKSEKTGRYLCFSERAKLIVRHHGDSIQCMFKEEITRENYTKFKSVANPLWYVGFRRNGKPAKGYRGNRREKCYQFLKQEKKTPFVLGLEKLSRKDYEKIKEDFSRQNPSLRSKRLGSKRRRHRKKNTRSYRRSRV